MLRTSALLIASLFLAAACGGDDDNGNGTGDAAAGTDGRALDAPAADALVLTTCAEDLAPVADASGAAETDPNVVISEVDPGAFIELYNGGNAPVLLSATGYFWCNNRSYPSFASQNVEIAPGGRRTIPWPGGGGVDGGGDVSIYSIGVFNGGAVNILDYVCWGDPALGGLTRLGDAVQIEKWTGPCAPAITAGGSLARLPNQNGTLAAHYAVQATPNPENCQ